jgi:hypothetical protein
MGPPGIDGEDGDTLAIPGPAGAAGTGGGGSATTTGAAGSEPGSPASGDLYLPNNGFVLERYSGSAWGPWGPLYPLTAPPVDTPTTATTLSGNGGSINNSTTTMLVASSSGFPATPFMCIVGTEQMKVTTVASLTWTITRGYNGSSAASHNDGVAVTLENWEWVNQSTATTTPTVNNGIFLTIPVSAISNLRGRKRLIGSNTRVMAALLPLLATLTTSAIHAGVFLRESSTGKMVSLSVVPANTTGPTLYVIRWSSPAATGTVDFSAGLMILTTPTWFRMDLVSTNILYYVSADGQNWALIATVAKATQFTTAPDEWGFCNVSSGGAFGAAETLISWKES